MFQSLVQRRRQRWAWMFGLCSALGAAALVAWLWLLRSLNSLPSPRSSEGRDLLYHYNRTSHDLGLALLGLVVVGLLWFSRRDPQRPPTGRPWHRQLLSFGREHPVVLLLFIAYTVAMVNGTHWLFPELVGWYDGIIDHKLLDNFSVRYEFISETMLRNDYRFFPLAHQDLHVLSWFTAYVKVWMLVSAAELLAIVVLAHRLIQRLSPGPPAKALLLMISLLMLSAPSTGFAFFQLIYAERMLTLCLMAFSVCYFDALQSGDRRSQALTLIWALIGLFFKEIAVLLFVTPALVTLIAGAAGRIEGRPALTLAALQRPTRMAWIGRWLRSYQLELWISSLLVVVVLAYVYLSYLPSLYHGKTAYSSNDIYQLSADPRLWIPLTYLVVRISTLLRHGGSIQLLDGLTSGAVLYAGALYVLVGYEGNSYMALPVQLVAVLDLAFAWTAWIAPRLSRRLGSAGATALAGVVGCAGFIAVEHQVDDNFLERVVNLKTKQASWLQTVKRIETITRDTRRSGRDVNVIYTKSWFRRNRHLDRFHYDRLVYLDPDTRRYSVVDGINKGSDYQPKAGDLLINIDKGGLGFLGDTLNDYEEVYRYSDRVRNGRIYRFRALPTAE
ncbi:putative membrane protein [Synechococcus sp. PROS-7-1]|uniref:hypothetical protein n=1 Tax=Synechococcus sp. PROS-7-1 TaxID=1442556 RepID=UPI0016488985|nr:hypothetical protein [Synechococcus sp. PROS-7-1]QNI84093.1 putative membrane protein [Synechococcus sp. PROS-7-1]